MALRIVSVYPDLLGTYGDRGNAMVLAHRARLRGIEVEVTEATSERALPGAELYCLGGGEDAPQRLAAQRLGADGSFLSAVGSGAVVLAVCAGLQLLGRSFPAGDSTVEGLGLVGIESRRVEAPRSVGEVLVRSERFGTLTGFENHAAHSFRDQGVAALGAVEVGAGNGDGTDGFIAGRLVGTYLHGPVLARNPRFADALLAMATGIDEGDLAEIDDAPARRLHDERVGQARR